MKDIIKIILMFITVCIVDIYRDSISNFITDEIIYSKGNKVLTYNEYYLDYDYQFVQNSDDNKVKSFQEILNIFYSILNSGDENYTFYCDYDKCMDDVKKLIDEKNYIANINNFVHPFNSFSKINIDVTQSGKVNVKSKKVYNKEQIKVIEDYITLFINDNISDNMSVYEKIKKFHDFIINNTIYDEDSNDESYTAYSLITTGKSICGGYSDIISIYLNALGIQNYRITSENHIWNLVNIDGVWYHIDATWDDPVASDGKQYLIDNFFMISTDQLFALDTVEHSFDKNIYKEANN